MRDTGGTPDEGRLVTVADLSAARDTSLRILLVEDSTPDAELLVDMLTDELPAASVMVASSLEQARRCFDDGFDVVVTDLSLPDAEGLQAVSAICESLPGVPVLVMTGRNDHDVTISAVSAGADDYLVKGAHDARGVATAVLYAVMRRRFERDTRRFERLALSLLDAMEAPTCAVDRHGEIVAVNRAWAGFAGGGEPSAAGLGRSYFDVCGASGEQEISVCEGVRQLLAGDLDRFQIDYPCVVAGEQRWFSLRVNPLPDGAGAVLTHIDISMAKQAEQTLAHQSMHDALTDLPNRNLLNDRLLQAMAAAQRSGSLTGVAFVDLDQFKRINDSLGHRAGDELLLDVTGRLRERVRAGDTLARFAGDEFVVIWPALGSEAEADSLAERLSGAFDAPFELTDATVTVTASVGVALGAAPESPDQLLLAADAAMYQAKSQGRGRTHMYTSKLREGAESRLRTEAELREALAARQFVLHYQPVVDLERKVVKGVEALVRWQHPEGLRMPDTFIPVAEASGLIVPLGAWVLDEACRQAAAWRADGLDLDMAVNLSVRQVSHPDVVSMIEEAITRRRLDPSRLLLEVTESAVMEDAEAAQVALEKIVSLGVAIAIDDFGTGYSSLLYLKRYPVRALKIDRSFVAGMGANEDDDAIVASIVSLARAVGSACIAEGVETPEQHAVLVGLGCDLAQGYLFGRPVPADEVPAAVGAAENVVRGRKSRQRSAGRRTAPAVAPRVLSRIEHLQDGGASAHTIAAALNREGAPHPQGIRWHRVAVTHLVAEGSLPPLSRRPPKGLPPLPAAPLGDGGRWGCGTSTAKDIEHVVARLVDGFHGSIAAGEAVLLLTVPATRALVEEQLEHRGVDVAALRESGRFTAVDAEAVLARITVDRYLSARLFRDVLGTAVESAVARYGGLHVYAELLALLYDRGDLASARKLDGLWDQLAAHTRFSLVCGYPPSMPAGDPDEHLKRIPTQVRTAV